MREGSDKWFVPAIMFKGSGWYITDYSDKMKPGGSDTAENQRQQRPKPATPTTSEARPALRPPLSDDLHDQRRARDHQLRDIQLEFHLVVRQLRKRRAETVRCRSKRDSVR